jgi:hypothetical protein
MDGAAIPRMMTNSRLVFDPWYGHAFRGPVVAADAVRCRAIVSSHASIFES